MGKIILTVFTFILKKINTYQFAHLDAMYLISSSLEFLNIELKVNKHIVVHLILKKTFEKEEIIMIPFLSSSSSRSGHSCLKQLAPVKLPSPPITTRLAMPKLTRLLAALSRPWRSRKSLHLALPIMVPP